MSITVTLTPATRSGICSLPLAALATESVTFTGADLADGVIVTVMQPDGSPVAIGTVASGAALLDLNTKEAHRATIALPVGATTKIFLVIGDTDALRFVVPALIQRNYLDDVIPPTKVAPSYPTRQELVEILIEMDNRVGSAKLIMDEAERIAGTVEPAVNEGLEAINGAVASGAGAIEALTKESLGELDTAKTDALTEIGNAKTNAETALQGKIDAATQSIAQSTETATNAAADATKAQEAAEEAEAGAEAAKEAAETALNNGCIYQVREVASPAITLDKTLTAYKHAPTADTTYTFTAPAEAEGKIIVFWLWLVIGETAHQLTFPAGVTWISEGSFAANTETLLAFMSTDGGATWQANLQWEK